MLFLEAVSTACGLRYETKANKTSQFGFIFHFGKAEFSKAANCLVHIPGLIILQIDRFLEKIFYFNFFFLSYRIFFLVGSQEEKLGAWGRAPLCATSQTHNFKS